MTLLIELDKPGDPHWLHPFWRWFAVQFDPSARERAAALRYLRRAHREFHNNKRRPK
jgi:hypothetical protein